MLSNAAFLRLVERGDYREVRVVLQSARWLASARDDDGRTAVECSAMSGYADITAMLIRCGAEVGRCGPAMLHAASEGWLDLIRILFYGGVRLDIQAEDRSTPLHLAAAKGHADLVRWLLYAGSNPKARNSERLTPLGLARRLLSGDELARIEEAFAEHAEEMLELRARSMTLEEAILHLDHRVLRHLLEAGTDPNVPGASGMAPLAIAAARSATRMFTALLKAGANPNVTTANGDCLLGWTIREGKLELARMLIDAGANLDDEISWDDTWISMPQAALRTGDQGLFELMVQRGADIYGRRNGGHSLLHRTAENGDVKASEYLLRRFCGPYGLPPGAKPRCNQHGVLDRDTPLHAAARYGHPEVVELLLRHGADPEVAFASFAETSGIDWRQWATDVSGCCGGEQAACVFVTPLILATWQGDVDACEALLNAGADANAYATVNCGETEANLHGELMWISPLHIAASRGNCHIIRLLLANGASPDKGLVSGPNQWPSVSFPSEMGLGITVQYAFSWPYTDYDAPLWSAVAGGHLEAANLLMAAGADPSAGRIKKGGGGGEVSYCEIPAISAAVASGKVDLVRALLEWQPITVQFNSESEWATYRHHHAIDDDEPIEWERRVCTPLWEACHAGNLEMVRVMVRQGADPLCGCHTASRSRDDDEVDDVADIVWHETAHDEGTIHAAACSGCSTILDLLVRAGVDVNVCDSDGNTPLHLAAREGKAEAVVRLIELGGHSDARNSEGKMPCHLSVRRGDVATTGILLDRMPPAVTADLVDELLLSAAERSDASVDMVHELNRRGASLTAIDNEGNTALHLAAIRYPSADQTALLSALLELGSEVNLANRHGRTALHCLVECGALAGCGLLLAHGADANAADEAGKTPLHVVPANNGREVCVPITRLLLEYGASADQRDAHQQTPLHMVAARCWGDDALAVVDLLLAEGASLSARDASGRQPLHLAVASFLRDSLVSLFVGKGSDLDAVDCHDETPLTTALLHRNDTIADILRAAGATETTLQDAILSDDLSLARRLVAAGADIDRRNSRGETPLHLAVRLGRRELCELLLNAGAIVNYDDSSRRTPLHLAAGIDRADIVELLLARGALLASRDASGDTPLHEAARHGSEETVRLLLSRGTTTEARNADGETPSDVATAHGHLDLAQSLHR